jgi:hypothetical protein
VITPNPTSHQPKSHHRRAKSGPGPGQFSVSDGRQAAGTIKQSGDSWVAITPTGEQIGPFPNMVEAARALPRIPGSSEVSA